MFDASGFPLKRKLLYPFSLFRWFRISDGTNWSLCNWATNWIGGFIQLVVQYWQLEEHVLPAFPKNTFLSPEVNCMAVQAIVPVQWIGQGALKRLKPLQSPVPLHRTTAPLAPGVSLWNNLCAEAAHVTAARNLRPAAHSRCSWAGAATLLLTLSTCFRHISYRISSSHYRIFPSILCFMSGCIFFPINPQQPYCVLLFSS